jgi:hypothetical protein
MDDGADDGVQTRAIAAAREHTDPHRPTSESAKSKLCE